MSSYNKLIDIKNLCENFCRSHVKSLSVASLEAPIQRCSLMKYGGSIGRYSFRPAVLNIFVKFLTLARELIFSTVVTFQYVLCQGWFLRNFPKIFRATFSKKTTSGTLVILRHCSLKVSTTPYNSLTPCSKERFVCRTVSVCVYPFVTTNITGLMNTTGWGLGWFLLCIHREKFVEIAFL